MDGTFTLSTDAGFTTSPGVHDVSVVATGTGGVLSSVDTSMEATADSSGLQALPAVYDTPDAETDLVPQTTAAALDSALAAARAEDASTVQLAGGVPIWCACAPPPTRPA